MPRSKELAPTLRARLCELKDIGWSYRQIQIRYPEIPKSTIRYTISKQKERNEQTSLRRSGRPKAISPEEEQRIMNMINENKNVKLREISEAVQSSPSVSTLQRLRKSKQCKKPEIAGVNTIAGEKLN